MNVEEFREHFESAQPILDAWGRFVKGVVTKRSRECGAQVQIATYRCKLLDSALGKIVRKTYADPIREMDDLVGVRIVVLLAEDVEKTKKIIENALEWTYSKERDPAIEIERAPDRFDYRSWHFVVAAKEDMEVDDVCVAKGTRCEIQVRTILQHAYAEMTHGCVYKSPWKAPVGAARYLASSSALIETTEHLFSETMRLLEEESRARGQFLNELALIYHDRIGVAAGFDKHLNLAILEQYMNQMPEDAHCLAVFVDDHPYIAARVKERLGEHPFWRQPIALLTYWLVEHAPEAAERNWPFAASEDALAQVFSDMGRALRH